jgi:Leucine-rich repeat (LRR) protein
MYTHTRTPALTTGFVLTAACDRSVENCSLTNATWLEQIPYIEGNGYRDFIYSLSVANNRIETLNVELAISTQIISLDVRGNPLKSFRLIRPGTVLVEDLDTLFFDGASERIEIAGLPLVETTRLYASNVCDTRC